MLRTFTNGSIEYFIDRTRSLIFGRWEGDFRGAELLETLPPPCGGNTPRSAAGMRSTT
jgi:hypothetical protein